MKQLVSGESDAKGLSVILPYIAVDPAAVAIRRPELWERLEFGNARLGKAGRGQAWLGAAWQEQGKEYGAARQGRAQRGAAGLGVAWQGTWAGFFRKNNKPTQPNGNNTQ